MTAFVYHTATSVNGFIADEDNSLAWLFEVEGTDPEMLAGLMDRFGVHVMGSTTYDWLIEHENLVEEPEKWTGFFGDLPTKVFSTRDLVLPAGVDIEVLRGPVAEHIDEILQLAGDKDAWIVGGGDLAGQFLDVGRLDRIELDVAPAFLLGGAPVLPRLLASQRLSLVEAKAHGPFALLTYDVLR